MHEPALHDPATSPATEGLVWVLEPVHFPAPITRWTAELFTVRHNRVLSRVCEEAGLLMEGPAFGEFHGRVYQTIVPLGGSARRRTPPARLVPALCRIVPTLRARIATFRRAQATDLPGRILDAWSDRAEDGLESRARSYLGIELGRLTGAQAADLLEAMFAFAERALWWRARLDLAGVEMIGGLTHELVTEHGWSGTQVMALFSGLSGATTGPAVGQQAIVDLVREAGAVHVLAAATTLEQVRAISPAVAAAVDGYLELWGERAVRYEIAAPTVAERPEWLLHVLQDQAERTPDRSLLGRLALQRERAEQHLFVTLGDTPATAQRLQRAQRAYPVREGNETVTVGLPVAALHRLGMHLGDRLGLDDPADVFDLWPAEVAAALRVGADPGLAALARRRRAERLVRTGETPPPVIGPAPGTAPPPPLALDGFPTDVAAAVRRVLWDREQVTGAVPVLRRRGAVIEGVPAAPGTYEGVARVVLDEDGFERIGPGDVLVCPVTSPVWSLVFPSVGALVCDVGGLMSHPAIIAREFGIPAVVGTGGATTAIADGARIRVDGTAGTVTLL